MNTRYNQIIKEKELLADKMRESAEIGNEELCEKQFKKYKKLESEAKKIYDEFFGRN